MKHDTDSTIPKEVITYAAGAIEAKLAEIARNTVQPEQELREWVAIFLLSSWTGLSNYMPALRGKAPKVDKTARKMEMANNSHSPSQKQRKQYTHRKKLTSGKLGFKYNGTHWMQQPKNKARVKELARKRAAARAAKKAA